METVRQTIQQLLEIGGFRDNSVSVTDEENRKLAVFMNEGEWFKKVLPNFVQSLDSIARLVAKKNNLETPFVDVNNYRLERERIIIEIAKAAARKAVMTKGDIELPAMNGYERRLVHMELATRPDVKTESIGEGKERRTLVRPL